MTYIDPPSSRASDVLESEEISQAYSEITSENNPKTARRDGCLLLLGVVLENKKLSQQSTLTANHMFWVIDLMTD